MADEFEKLYNGSVNATLWGRRVIYATFEDINADNVKDAVNEALAVHMRNLMEEEVLYWYRRGVQKILGREKEIRPEITNRIVENHAEEIVSFKNGWFLTKPAVYVSRSQEEDVLKGVDKLNEFLYRSGKHHADNEIVDWFHTVGKGVLYVKPNDDKERPFSAYALDPRSAFVVYSMEPDHHPVMGVNMVVSGEKVKYDVFTEDSVYRIEGGVTGKFITDYPVLTGTAVTLTSVERNALRKIPIIEYAYNSVNMGAFEAVVPLLDAINEVQSNRLDGIEQFVQSLLVFYNCTPGVDADGNEVTPRMVRDAGAIYLKNAGEYKADLKEIASQLDQTQTQVLVDYLYQQVLTICGMPTTTKGGSSTSDTGSAVLARDGWYQAGVYAENTADLFKKSNAYFDDIVLDILKRKDLLDLKSTDFELQIVRNETANMQSKAQTYRTLVDGGIHPILAMKKSDISSDPDKDFEMSKEYLAMKVGDPSAQETFAVGTGGVMQPDGGGQGAEPESGSAGYAGGNPDGQENPEAAPMGAHWVRGYWKT